MTKVSKRHSKSRLLAICVAILATLFMLMPMPRAHAGWRERTYTVIYDCIISPPGYYVEGEWTYYCDGTVSGWGWQPGHDCSRSEITYGEWCGPFEPQP